MTTWPHLSKAPIREALIDVRLEEPIVANQEEIERALNELKNEYPTRETRTQHEQQVTFGPQVKPTAETRRRFQGVFARDPGRSRLIQFRLDGFTFNSIGLYPGWASFKQDAMNAWKCYRRLLRDPITSPRLGLRFINEVQVRPDPGEWSRYLTSLPRIPVAGKVDVERLQSRVTYRTDAGVIVHVTHAMQAGDLDSEGKQTIILDIDAFLTGRIGLDSIGVLAEKLRDAKNEAFFGGLTRQCVEVYQ